MKTVLCKKGGRVYRVVGVSTTLVEHAIEEFVGNDFVTELDMEWRDGEGYSIDEWEKKCRKVKTDDAGKWISKNCGRVGEMSGEVFVKMVGAHRRNSLNYFKKNRPIVAKMVKAGSIKDGEECYYIVDHKIVVEDKKEGKVEVSWYSIMKDVMYKGKDRTLSKSLI